VVAQLRQLHLRAADYMRCDNASAEDAYFYAKQNARLVMNAEEYYRTMFQGRVSSWNLRDRHMADTLDALLLHLQSNRGAAAKLVVWAHNSHIGDARATEAHNLGEWNLGQLMRERHGARVRLIGCSTYDGWVTAASRWDGPAQRKRVLPALQGSYEALLHEHLPSNYVLPLTAGTPIAGAFGEKWLERAIGVLYLPATERQSHYFFACLPRQFDAVLHIDRSNAVTPLETVGRPGAETPETFPAGV
jgi:erythromycin esterase-like protein